MYLRFAKKHKIYGNFPIFCIKVKCCLHKKKKIHLYQVVFSFDEIRNLWAQLHRQHIPRHSNEIKHIILKFFKLETIIQYNLAKSYKHWRCTRLAVIQNGELHPFLKTNHPFPNYSLNLHIYIVCFILCITWTYIWKIFNH